MLIIFVRTLLLYLLVVIVTRLMGKRQIGELQPYEFVITIMIAVLVAVPMQDRGLSLFSGVIPVLTLLLVQVVFSYWSLKSLTFRRILCGKPSPIMEKGQINWAEMRSNLIMSMTCWNNSVPKVILTFPRSNMLYWKQTVA